MKTFNRKRYWPAGIADADFICVGMFDFQVAEDAPIAQLALEKSKGRERPCYG